MHGTVKAIRGLVEEGWRGQESGGYAGPGGHPEGVVVEGPEGVGDQRAGGCCCGRGPARPHQGDDTERVVGLAGELQTETEQESQKAIK